jgi:hypothetical protein
MPRKKRGGRPGRSLFLTFPFIEQGVPAGECEKHPLLRFLQHQLWEAPSIQVPELREDILRELRHTLPSTPTSSRDLRRSRRTQRGRSEQVCNRTGKADRLEYRRSLARKGSSFVSSVQRSKSSNSQSRSFRQTRLGRSSAARNTRPGSSPRLTSGLGFGPRLS